MVNEMPGNNVYGNTSNSSSQSRTPPSFGAGGKGSQSTHTTVSTGKAITHNNGGNPSYSSRMNVKISRNSRLGASSNRDTSTPSVSGKENSNSSRGSGSGSDSVSVSDSARKIQRSSFRRKMMFQKSKRDSGGNVANNEKNETVQGVKSPNSGVSLTSAANKIPTGRSPNRFHGRLRAFRGNVGRAVVPSTVEEREDGADSPTFPQPNEAKHACNEQPSSSSSAAVHAQHQSQSQNQSTQEAVTGKGGKSLNGEELPRCHVDTILRFYGGDDMSPASLDLYRDVLRVSPDASDREIRIAYFRRGREILGDNDEKTNHTYAAAKAKATKLDSATKFRFQAVSMAYEILSTPSWRATYLQQGGLIKRSVTNKEKLSNADPFSSPPSTVAAAFPNTNIGDVEMLQKMEFVNPSISPNPKDNVAQRRRSLKKMPQRLRTALRKSTFTGNGQNGKRSPGRISPSFQRSSSSVRWKDHVEELVFANHPNEHASEDDSDSDDSDENSNDEDDIFEDDDIAASNGKKPADQVSRSSSSKNGNSRNTRDVNANDSNEGTSRSRRRRKNKQRILIDSDELESHLQRMDNEAEKHFVQDFWDNFEESMDGILTIVDSIGGGDSSKGTTNKSTSKNSSTTISFSNASSWLSPALSTNSSSSSVSKRQIISQGNPDVTDATIEQSLSPNLTISSKSVAEDECNKEVFVKLSNSSPLQSSSPSTLDAVSPSPLPPSIKPLGSDTGTFVTPDENGATATKTSSDSRASPFEMIVNSWPFQSSKSQKEENVEPENKQPTMSPVRVVTSPVIISPSPKSKSTTKASVNNKGGMSSPSIDLDTTMSVASSILSTSQRRQQFFRPISPCPSEASEVATSDFLPATSSLSISQKNGPESVSVHAKSDQFELDSHLSGMESLDLTELDNPFRSQDLSHSSSTDAVAKKSLSVPSNNNVSDDPNNSNNSASKGQKKKNRFRVSMISKIKGSLTEEEVYSSQNPVQTDKSSICSVSSKSEQSMEDVFAGVDEDADLQQDDMVDGGKLNVQAISIKRSTSHMSDLSAYSSRREDEDDGEVVGSEFASLKPSAENPTSESVTVTLGVSSMLSSSTKKSLLNSSAGRSQGSTAYSTYASSTRDDANSVHSVESKGVEESGFFEYFMAYVSAVITECADVGASAGVAEYHQDFLSLFSNDAIAHTAEIREQPTSMHRVPTMSTKSTSSC